MTELGGRAQSQGAVYFTGGSTALLLGIRDQTIDINIKLDPEPKGVFQSLAALKNQLNINVELAAPSDFIAVTPDWRERGLYIGRRGPVAFFHFDLRAQVLAKIERGYQQDLTDARELMRHGQISKSALRDYFQAIRPELIRYPAVDAKLFEAKLEAFCSAYGL